MPFNQCDKNSLSLIGERATQEKSDYFLLSLCLDISVLTMFCWSRTGLTPLVLVRAAFVTKFLCSCPAPPNLWLTDDTVFNDCTKPSFAYVFGPWLFYFRVLVFETCFTSFFTCSLVFLLVSSLCSYLNMSMGLNVFSYSARNQKHDYGA